MTQNQPLAWTTENLLKATRGKLLCGDLGHLFTGVSIDSRSIYAGDVFVAIIGEIHDGHAFLENIVDQGVRGLVVSRRKTGQLPLSKWGKSRVVCIAVENTTRALGDMAAFNRQRSQIRVVGITGSNGKTTTRRMATAVMERHYDVLTAAGNFNNEIGLPLTLLGLSAAHQWALLELGTNQPGEIARLADICSPDIGVLTNIGPAHLEGLGSIDGVMKEKGDLIKKLGSNGTAILNADDPRVSQLASTTEAELIFYGLTQKAAIKAEDIKDTGFSISFNLILAGQSIAITLNCPGRFMVSNALAAAAVGHQIGLSIETIKAGLEGFEPVSGRMNVKRLAGDIHLIDDTYNANPDSMKAAFSTLSKMSAGARRAAVLGDMLELGDRSQSLHREVGAGVASAGVSRLYVCGEFAAEVIAGARREGMRPADTCEGTHAEIVEDLKVWLHAGDWLLVKGSRGAAMEKVVEGLTAWAGEEMS
jgi:UDP-N-acetylmuramoyl-tripeptide--D-alanyl-D-alanine ligase